MAKPLVVTIPHRLGKEEAVRRMKAGIEKAQKDFASIITIENAVWNEDQLTFACAAMGQRASGIIDVREDNVQLEVTLPWLLATIAEKAKALISQRGHLMLEKK